MNFCNICGGQHEQIRIINSDGSFGDYLQCPQCMGCFKLCMRNVEAGCKWAPSQPAIPITNQPGITVQATPTIGTHLKESFKAWVASSDFIKNNVDIDAAWAEFEIYANEKLSPVDQNKNYLQMVQKGDNIKFAEVDKTKLHRNQEGKYILVDGNRRTRVGKVAVVED